MNKAVKLQTIICVLTLMLGVVLAPTAAQEHPTVPEPLWGMPAAPDTPRPFGTSAEDAIGLPKTVDSAVRPEYVSYHEPRATFRVNSTVDSPDSNTGDGVCQAFSGGCTLRAAVMQASASGLGMVILPGGSYALTIPTGTNDPATGDLNIAAGSTVIIRADELSFTPTIRGNNDATTGFRVFSVAGTLILDGAFVTAGRSSGAGGCILVLSEGAMLFSNGFLSRCESGLTGGAVGMQSNTYVEVFNSNISSNTALGISAIGTGFGGATTSSLVMTNVTVSNNRATNGDSAINITGGWLTMTNVTVSDNRNEKLVASSTTTSIAGVSASPATANALTLTHVTIADNTSSGTDVGLYIFGSTHSLQFRNSILAENTGGTGAVNTDCESGSFSGTALVTVNSIVGDIGGCSHASTNLITGISPQLQGLESVGGQIPLTRAFAPTSLALDNGAREFCSPTDARGVSRNYGLECDLGAYELITRDMLTNSSFNPFIPGTACVLTPWAKNATYKKDRANKNNPHTGECAFRFVSHAGKATTPGVLRHNFQISPDFRSMGNNVTFSAYINAPIATINATARLRVTYTDGTPATVANFPINQTTGYSFLTGSVELASLNVQRIQLRFIDRTTSGGSWFIDDVRVFVSKT